MSDLGVLKQLTFHVLHIILTVFAAGVGLCLVVLVSMAAASLVGDSRELLLVFGGGALGAAGATLLMNWRHYCGI